VRFLQQDETRILDRKRKKKFLRLLEKEVLTSSLKKELIFGDSRTPLSDFVLLVEDSKTEKAASAEKINLNTHFLFT
jgi:hypothetical protein